MKLYSVAILVEFDTKGAATPFLDKAVAANLAGTILLKATTVLATNTEQAYTIAKSFIDPGVVCSAHVTEIPTHLLKQNDSL
jgi:hypothetical protein